MAPKQQVGLLQITINHYTTITDYMDSFSASFYCHFSPFPYNKRYILENAAFFFSVLVLVHTCIVAWHVKVYLSLQFRALPISSRTSFITQRVSSVGAGQNQRSKSIQVSGLACRASLRRKVGSRHTTVHDQLAARRCRQARCCIRGY